MCPVIRISDDTFAMLQKVAQPLVDTPDSAIRRALVAFLEKKPTAELPSISTLGKQESIESKLFNCDLPPDLTHASFRNGEVGSANVKKWNYLMVESHALAFIALGRDLAELKRVSGAHIRQGLSTDSGFKPVNNFGFSVQAVEANKAWAISLKLAKEFKFPISIEFQWLQKEGAAFPGKVGRMIWKPSN